MKPMSMQSMRTVAEVSLNSIVANHKKLHALAPKTESVPMVKANAYGHGLVPVGKKLAKQKHVLALGVATLDEAVNLRISGIRKAIWVFSDCAPWTEEVSRLCRRYEITPVLSSEQSFHAFIKSKSKLPFHLKFNTGMNRLGISIDSLDKVSQQLKLHRLKPEGICTHLSMSEKPKNKFTMKQVLLFKNVIQEMSGFAIPFIHCENTMGIVSRKTLGVDQFCNVVRPGIGLYGYGVQELGLKPALLWKAKVVRCGELKKTDRVGYGGRFQANTKMPFSVLAVGYGDGLSRALSQKEILIYSGSSRRERCVKVLGHINMDLTNVGYPYPEGSWVELLGASIEQGFMMEKARQTIIYECLTSISSRVPREYK